MSEAEAMMMLHLRACRLPEPVREYRFHPVRRWRFDMAWPDRMLAVEIDGGMWVAGGGRHNRGQGFTNDCEKLNHAVLAGWRVLRFTPEMVKEGTAIRLVEQVIREGSNGNGKAG